MVRWLHVRNVALWPEDFQHLQLLGVMSVSRLPKHVTFGEENLAVQVSSFELVPMRTATIIVLFQPRVLEGFAFVAFRMQSSVQG